MLGGWIHRRNGPSSPCRSHRAKPCGWKPSSARTLELTMNLKDPTGAAPAGSFAVLGLNANFAATAGNGAFSAFVGKRRRFHQRIRALMMTASRYFAERGNTYNRMIDGPRSLFCLSGRRPEEPPALRKKAPCSRNPRKPAPCTRRRASS